MKSGIKNYINDWEKELNVPLMTKENDAPLVEYIKDAWKSLEVSENIRITGFDYTEEESAIDINNHIFKREKKKKKKERYDIKMINDSRVGKLTAHIEITMIDTDPKDPSNKVKNIYLMKKSMLIPIQDDEGYYYINGKKYYMIYQLLEKSTYTSASSITLKSLMPVAVKRKIVDCEDINGNLYRLLYYNVFVFRREIPIILFYLTKGLNYTLNYLNVIDLIHVLEDLPSGYENDLSNLYFQISSKCYLQVDRNMFEKSNYIQSVVGGFLVVSSNRTTISTYDESSKWIKKIANPANYEKGLGILKYFNRLLDNKFVQVKPL